jgi:hypothetical protein
VRKGLVKLEISEKRKTHYKELANWLKLHPQIEYSRLAIGFSINIKSIPIHLVEEFLTISTFKEK